MIEFQKFQCTYPSVMPNEAPIPVLSELSLHIQSGECLAIVGDNGSGKTSLCLAAAQVLHLTDAKISGTVQINPAKRIGLVLENPHDGFFQPTIADEIGWGLENLGIPPLEINQRIQEMLKQVNLEYLPWDRSPHTLSGGEQKRLAIAIALATNPDILILDQPTNGLSSSATLQTLRKSQPELTILITDYGSNIIHTLADKVLQLENGKLCLLSSQESRNKCGTCLAPLTELARLEALNIRDPGMKYPPAIELINLNYRYPDNRIPLFHNINLQIPQRQFVALLGENGAGKSTLARHLIGLTRPTQGQVRIFGKDIIDQSIGQLAHTVGFAFQNPELQIFSPTVRDEIAFGPRNLGITDPAVTQQILDAFHLNHLADHPPAALSFSQRRRVALASIAAMHTPILLLDEPTVGLDAANQAQIINWLIKTHQAGTTIILITHDRALAEQCAERIIFLDNGHIDE
jgi:energy-coupling factor transporter ATP-binding protein EcfA2